MIAHGVARVKEGLQERFDVDDADIEGTIAAYRKAIHMCVVRHGCTIHQARSHNLTLDRFRKHGDLLEPWHYLELCEACPELFTVRTRPVLPEGVSEDWAREKLKRHVEQRSLTARIKACSAQCGRCGSKFIQGLFHRNGELAETVVRTAG